MHPKETIEMSNVKIVKEPRKVDRRVDEISCGPRHLCLSSKSRNLFSACAHKMATSLMTTKTM